MKILQLRNSSIDEMITAAGVETSKAEAMERFAALPFPDKRSEAYRYADFDKVWEKDFAVLTPDPVEPRAGRNLVITDGIVTESPSEIDVKYSDSFGMDAEHYDPVYYLSHALSPRAIEITLKDGDDLTIEHSLRADGAIVPYRIVIRTAPNAHLKINEKFADTAGAESLLLYGYDIDISADTTLSLVKDQTIESGSYLAVASHSIDVGSNAHLLLKSFDFGSGQGVQQIRVILGERASTDMSHLLYAKGDARRGTVSQIVHRGEHSTSSQNAKNILKESARGIFDALIRVDNSARYTKAHQNSKAVLLDSGAYMASKPQLEIYIDELEASHGSTTGQLDERQLFYLRSRGISEHEARKMLILAFANEIIDTIDDKILSEQIHASFEKAYYGDTN